MLKKNRNSTLVVNESWFDFSSQALTIHFASVTNSGDGYSEEPLEIGTAWNAFGHSNLPIAAPGFALSSPILKLQEVLEK